jgi:hypothetical protein
VASENQQNRFRFQEGAEKIVAPGARNADYRNQRHGKNLAQRVHGLPIVDGKPLVHPRSFGPNARAPLWAEKFSLERS